MRPGRQTTPDASPEPLPVKVKTERPEPAVSASSQLNNTVPIDSHSQSNKGAASVQSKPKNKSSLGTREGMQGRRDIAIKEEDGEGGHEEEEGSTDGREQPLEEKDKEVNTTKTTDDGSKTRKAKNDSLSEAKDCSREEETVDDNHERGSGDKEGSTSANSVRTHAINLGYELTDCTGRHSLYLVEPYILERPSDGSYESYARQLCPERRVISAAREVRQNVREGHCSYQ